MKLFLALLSACVLIFVMAKACEKKAEKPFAKLPEFSLTNYVVGGVSSQVLRLTNGMELHFNSSNVVIWFNEESSLVVALDPAHREPKSILLARQFEPGQPVRSVFDNNADGIPEFRATPGKTNRELFYNGHWYAFERRGKGRSAKILVGKKEVNLKYGGVLWEEDNGTTEKGSQISD